MCCAQPTNGAQLESGIFPSTNARHSLLLLSGTAELRRKNLQNEYKRGDMIIENNHFFLLFYAATGTIGTDASPRPPHSRQCYVTFTRLDTGHRNLMIHFLLLSCTYLCLLGLCARSLSTHKNIIFSLCSLQLLFIFFRLLLCALLLLPQL